MKTEFIFRLSGGELFDKICELEYLTEFDACCYMKQVLEAIDHLHDNSVVHLDIKVPTLQQFLVFTTSNLFAIVFY